MTTPARPTPQHTPLPWVHGKNRCILVDPKTLRWVAVFDEGYAMTPQEAQANADLVLQSVNALPALAAARLALEESHEILKLLCVGDDPSSMWDRVKACEHQARHALALLRDGAMTFQTREDGANISPKG